MPNYKISKIAIVWEDIEADNRIDSQIAVQYIRETSNWNVIGNLYPRMVEFMNILNIHIRDNK